MGLLPAMAPYFSDHAEVQKHGSMYPTPSTVAPAVERTLSTWILGRIRMVAARHAEIPEDELRQEREVEADEGDDRRASLEIDSGYMRPVILGHQKCTPARNAISMPPTMTKWKWATMK